MPDPIEQAASTSPVDSFDRQARCYDARVGLPAPAGVAVARAVFASADARADDLVVELGAGTGEIGVPLSRLPVQYIGLDASAAMLEEFRAKAAPASPSLIVADCDRTWPLPDDSATVVFASRVIHLLQPDHVVRETVRVCRPAGLLVLGRVVRDRDSMTERLRRKRLDLLTDAGISARKGESGTRRVIEDFRARGAECLGRQIVAEWTNVTTSGEIIAGWESLARWGSVVIDATTRASMLKELRTWARRNVGDLNRSEASPVHYAIDIVRL